MTLRKTYLSEVVDLTVVCLLLLALTARQGTDTAAGVISLVAFLVVFVRLGLTVTIWFQDAGRRRKTADRRRRRLQAESMARHPSGRRPAQDHPVHNHGPHDGPGLECREYGRKDGTLVGACILRQRALEGLDR